MKIRRHILCKDEVDHVDEHPVLQGLSGILDDRNDVCAAGSHVDQVATRTVRELDSVNGSGRANNVGDMGDGGTGGSTKVEGLGAGLDVDGLETSQDTSSQLRSEGVPDTIFGLGGGTVLGLCVLDRNALLIVDALTRSEVSGGEQVFLAAANDKDTLVTVGFLKKSKCEYLFTK